MKILNFKNFLVFKNANVHTNIIIAQKNPKNDEIEVYQDLIGDKMNSEKLESNFNHFILNRNELSEDWVITGDINLKLISKIEKDYILLGELAIIEKGSTSGKNKIFTVSYETAEIQNFEAEILRKNVKNGDIERYFFRERGDYLIYIDKNTVIKNYPNIYNYLLSHKKELSERNEVKKGLYSWYRLERPRKKEVFDYMVRL
jgi:hypothetical protein